MPKLYFLVGVVGSGKSSYRSKIDDQDATILSTDDYIEKYAMENDLTYSEAFETEYKTAEMNLRKELCRAILHNKDIIWDQTNTTAKSRTRKLKLIPKNYEKIAVFFDTNPAIIHSVNMERASRGRSIPTNVVNNMIQSLQRPNELEGFDKIIHIKRDE